MCVYMHVLEWNFLIWSGLPDPADENIPAVKKIGNAWSFPTMTFIWKHKHIFNLSKKPKQFWWQAKSNRNHRQLLNSVKYKPFKINVSMTHNLWSYSL